MNTLFYWSLFFGCLGILAHFMDAEPIYVVTWLIFSMINNVGSIILRELKNETKNGK